VCGWSVGKVIMFDRKERSSVSADDDAASKHLFAQEPKHPKSDRMRENGMCVCVCMCL